MTGKAPPNKRARDVNQLAKSVVDEATSGDENLLDTEQADLGKDPAAVSLGRRGGLKGGVARAQALSPEVRSEIAKRAAQKRWKARDEQ